MEALKGLLFVIRNKDLTIKPPSANISSLFYRAANWSVAVICIRFLFQKVKKCVGLVINALLPTLLPSSWVMSHLPIVFANTVQVLNEQDQCNQLRAIFLSPPCYQFDGHICRAELFQNALSISWFLLSWVFQSNFLMVLIVRRASGITITGYMMNCK